VRKTVLTLALAAAFSGGMAAPALAGPTVPTTPCEIQEFLGYENVKECEDASS
jgi:hypothetical protein